MEDKSMRKDASLSIVRDKNTNKFLMIRHHRGINKGCINFPGGKKEVDETMEECVIRETLEETGILIRNPKQVGYIEFPGVDFFVWVFMSDDDMREADRNFLPEILAGKYVRRRYVYDENFHIKEIVDL